MKIPTPEEMSSALQDKQKQRTEITATISSKKIEAGIIAARISDKKEEQGDVQSNSIQRILGQKTGEDILPDRDQLNKLRGELEVLDRALNAIDGVIRNEKIAASLVVCSKIKPEHDRLARHFATKLLELHAAHSEYEKFIDSVDETGTRTTSLGVIHPTFLGSVRDRSGCYHHTLREFADAGHIQRSNIPESVS